MRLLFTASLSLFTLAGAACIGDAGDDTLGDDLDETSEVESSLTSSCVGAVNDELPQASLDQICNAGLSNCASVRAMKNRALASCATGILRRFRVRASDGRHGELIYNPYPFPLPRSPLEATFAFALTPQPGGSRQPLYRCVAVSSGTSDDFLTTSTTCEGAPGYTRRSWSGYTYAPGTVGTAPLYRCRIGGDHFFSRSATCEGQVREGVLGNVRP
jgi:hypothetical protein